MIRMLGQGSLYHIQRNRQKFVTQKERRRSVLLLFGTSACIAMAILLWLIYR